MKEDLLIRQALLDAALADYGTAGLLEAPSFSTKYLAWEKKFLRNPLAFAQRALRPVWKTALRSAACFLLVASLSFGSLMAFSPQARAWVASWFVKSYSDHVEYHFAGDYTPITENLQKWTPTYLPDGYVQTDFIDLPGVVSILYNNDDPTMEIEFSYQLMSNIGEQLDNERHTPSPRSIRGMQGEFWESTDGSQNFLVWFDEENKHAFLLMSRQPRDVLIQIAESVELVK